MPIILTNILTFIETPGRRRVIRRGSFDQLTCILMGPQAKRDQWVPNLESPHTQIDPQGYPLMLCTGVDDVEQEGALVTTSITYQGRMFINGFQPTPVLSINSTETSGSIQMAARQTINQGKSQVVGAFVNGKWMKIADIQADTVAPNGFVSFGTGITFQWIYGQVGQVVRYGYSTVTINYISTSVTARYQMLTRPIGPQGGALKNGAQVGIISTIIGEVSGVEVTYQADGTTGGAILPPVIGPDFRTLGAPVPKLVCSSFSANQTALGFYDCSETWEYKYIDSSHTV